MAITYDDWRRERLAALTAEDGWLNLTDRVELQPGAQTVGTDPGNDVVLRAGPDHLGVLTLTDGAASFQTPGGQPQPFLPAAGGFPQLRVPPLLLELHSVDGIPALRVRDLMLPRSVELRHFPFNPSWVIRAAWEKLETPLNHMIGQRGGAETAVSSSHAAKFSLNGQSVALLPTHWKLGQPMFVIRDATSGKETYAASRFLMGEDMTDREITLDFNRAFTPPCGFTDFAICPLPPRENILPFTIDAGERLT